MSDVLIDILVPTNNSDAGYLKQAIESAFAQTEKRWRMYIRDNCSEVDVQKIVEPYLKDPRVSFVRSDHKGTIGYNWNKTMELGNAPYVQFLFQDDWWEEKFLERALGVMEANPDVGIVSLEHEYVCDDGAESIPLYKQLEEFRRGNLQPGRHDGRDILRYWVDRELHPNIAGEPDFIMLRRELMTAAGPYLEDMPQNLDMEYSLRCMLRSNWYYIRENCGWFRVHAQAESAVNQREGKGVFDRFRCFEELLKQLPAGADRQLTVNARNRALTDMAGKFLNRVKQGGSVKTGGGSGGAFKKFALAHPLLILGALWRAWRKD